MFIQGNLQPVHVSGTVHSTASGKRGKIINQIITHHTNFDPEPTQTCSLKGNLHPFAGTVTVQQVGKGGKIINQIITHHTNFNPESAQVYSLKGNLQIASQWRI